MKDTPFPSVTICTEGINMDAIIEVADYLLIQKLLIHRLIIIILGCDSGLQHLVGDSEENVNQ